MKSIAITYETKDLRLREGGGRGVLPEKLGGAVRLASQKPYPIYDQNLRYALPYLWPDQKFETLFMTWPLHQNPVSNMRFN